MFKKISYRENYECSPKNKIRGKSYKPARNLLTFHEFSQNLIYCHEFIANIKSNKLFLASKELSRVNKCMCECDDGKYIIVG